MDTVPNRDCGECIACCQFLTIDTDEFRSESGVLCSNCLPGKGCKIYDSRPQVCRNFHCGWRLFDHFDENWRPDKSGILIMTTNKDIPGGYQAAGFELYMTDSRLALSKPALIEFLVASIEEKIPVTLCLMGPRGHHPSYSFLNPELEDTVLKRDEAGFLKIFTAILKNLENSEFRRVIYKYEGKVRA